MNRKQGEEDVIEILTENEQHFQRNSKKRVDNKQEYVYLVVRGGAGTGKSRACRETKRMVADAVQTKQLPSHYQYSIFLLMDYSNGDQLSFEEVQYGPEVALGLRIFLKLFHNEKPSKFVQTLEYQFLCENHLLDLDIAFQAASRRLHTYFELKSEVDIPILLLLDEFQKNKAFFPGKMEREKEIETPFWRIPLHRIGQYCVDTAKANENYNRDHLMVTTMIAGTLNEDDLQFHPTDYGHRNFPLPLFKFEMILEILEYCVENKRIPPWAIDSSYHRFWWMMGLIPRTLEFALLTLNELKYDIDRKKINQNDLDILVQLHRKTSNVLSGYYTARYESEEMDDVLLLRLSCTNVSLLSLGKQIGVWVKEKKRSGKIFTNSEQNTLFLPQVVFAELNEKSSKAPFPDLPPFYRFNFEDFETFDLKKITNSFNLLLEQQIKTISIRELLRVGGNQNTLDIKIPVNERIYREEVEDFISVNNKKKLQYHHLEDAVVTSKIIVKENLLDYVFKTNKGCYLVDGRVWLSKKHLLLIQYKYRIPSEDLKKETNDVLEWVNEVKSALEKKYRPYELIYLYITTSMIPERQKEEIKKSFDNVLYVDRSNMESYAPTNLYPYLMTPSNEEIELLKFIEIHRIKKTVTRAGVTIEDMKEILDFLEVPKVDRSGLKVFGEYLDFTLERIRNFSRREVFGSLSQNDL